MDKSFLLVEDVLVMREMIKKILIKHLQITEIYEANNGLEAVQQARLKKPDVIILDIAMPEMDGITALEEIMKVHPTAIVIMVTGMSQGDCVKRAIMAGAKAFVTKPFTTERLLTEILRAMGVVAAK